MPKLTAWIKCRDQQPTLPGWYDVRDCGREWEFRLRWDGREWRHPNGTWMFFGTPSFPSDAWRGLAESPTANSPTEGA